MVVSGSNDKTVRLWDTATGGLQRILKGYTSWVTAVAFSPDGKLLASGSDDHAIRLWDPAMGTLQQTLESDISPVNTVAISPNGNLVVSTSSDKTVRLWDLGTGELLQTLEVHLDEVIGGVFFSGDGQYLCTDRRQLAVCSFPNVRSSSAKPETGNGMVKGKEMEIEGTISVNGNWVIRGTEKVLWLPPSYRATCTDVRNDVLVIGHASGGVSVLGFSPIQ
jgi:Tol biopolymer transport system component